MTEKDAIIFMYVFIVFGWIIGMAVFITVGIWWSKLQSVSDLIDFDMDDKVKDGKYK